MATIQLDRRPTTFRGFRIHDFAIPLQTILIHDFTHPLQQYIAFHDFGSFNTKRPGSLSSELSKSRTPVCQNLLLFHDPTLLHKTISGFRVSGLRESCCSNSLSSRTPGIRSTEVSNPEISVLLLLSEVNSSKPLLIQRLRSFRGFMSQEFRTLTSRFPGNRITEISFQGFP
jgi:hypothetical protein